MPFSHGNGTVEYTIFAKLLTVHENHADFVNANEDIVLPELYLRGKYSEQCSLIIISDFQNLVYTFSPNFYL